MRLSQPQGRGASGLPAPQLPGLGRLALGLHCCMHGLSLVVVSRGYALVAVPGLLTAVASLVVEQGLSRAWTQ